MGILVAQKGLAKPNFIFIALFFIENIVGSIKNPARTTS